MIGMAQRASQMSESQNNQYGTKSMTPFKTPSHSVNMPGSQAFGKDIFNGSAQVYHPYAASTNSTHHQSQPYDSSQAFSINRELFTAQKRNPISQMPTQDSSRNENRAKFERFLQEIQAVLSCQLDKVRDEIAKDLNNFKDVDSSIKKGLGLDVSSLSEEISCLKVDLKTAITSFSSKLEAVAKEQSEEIQKVSSAISQPKKNLKLPKGSSAKSLQDNLSSTFNYLKHEISDLSSQIALLKDQMKQDTQFAIDRITQVRDKYSSDFSLNSQRQSLINEKFISLLQQEKKRNQNNKPQKVHTERIPQETPEPENQEIESSIIGSKKGHVFPPIPLVSDTKSTPLPSGNQMDIEKPPEILTAQVRKRGRPKRADSEVFLSEKSKVDDASFGLETQNNIEEHTSPIPTQKSKKRTMQAQQPDSKSEESKENSVTSIDFKPAITRRIKGGDWIVPASNFREFTSRFDYLRLPPEELKRREKLQKKKGKGKSKIPVELTYSSIREERRARRRESLNSNKAGVVEKSVSGQKRTIINKEEQLAKETAVQQYGEKSANVITQVSQIVKKAKKTVGKMRGRVNCTMPLTNS
jgi:hypothetical protein